MTTEGIDGVSGNTFLGNSIFGSGALGIDNDPDGVTVTNLPVIDLAVSGVSRTRVGGTISAVANSTYRIEVFSSSAANGSGFGEGETFLGFANATTDATGFARFNFSTSTLVSVGDAISATATLEGVGTSEFAQSVAARSSLVVTTTLDAGGGSLREAIADANLAGGGDVIEFDISGAGPHTITLATEYPDITDLTVIDGRSEPNFVASPVIELAGGGALGTGLDFQPGSDGSEVLGLSITGFTIRGIFVGAADMAIRGNYIGLATDGTTRSANDWGIQILNAPRTVIGGTAQEDRNVISGNDSEGVRVSGVATVGTQVIGNYIGTTAGGDVALANFREGVNILSAPTRR